MNGDAILEKMAKVVAVRAIAAYQEDNWAEAQGVIIDLAPTLERAEGFTQAETALRNPKWVRGAKVGKEIGALDQFRQKAIDAQMADITATIYATAKVVALMVLSCHESPEFYTLVMTEVTRKA